MGILFLFLKYGHNEINDVTVHTAFKETSHSNTCISHWESMNTMVTN